MMRRRLWAVCPPARAHRAVPHPSDRGFPTVPYSADASMRRPTLVLLAVIAALLVSLTATVRPTQAAPVDAGFIDHSYNASSVDAPTKDKPQSKVWFADGSWWGGLFGTGTNDHRIHRYNAGSNTWTATSTVVDQ